MKHLIKFENFDLGRFSENEQDDNAWMEQIEDIEDEFNGIEDEDDMFDEEEELDEEGNQIKSNQRIWGDELVENLTAKQKKLPKALQDSILKKQGKNVKKDSKKEEKEEKVEKKEEFKGLTAKQKKLPKALQDSILKRQKK